MRLLTLLSVAAVAVAGAIAGVLLRPPSAAATPAGRPLALAAATPSAPSTAVAPPHAWTGVLLVGQDVDVAPKAEGRVQSIVVKPGEHVRRGALLSRLDVRAARTALRLAESSLADAEARLARRSGMVAGVLSQEEVANARLVVIEKRARVEEVRALVRDADIRAPFDGVVTTRFVDPGAMVGPARPLLRLVGGRDMRVRFAIPEEDAGAVAVGARVSVGVKLLPHALAGVVTGVAPEVDSAARMIIAIADVKAPPDLSSRLAAGMVARVSLDASASSAATVE